MLRFLGGNDDDTGRQMRHAHRAIRFVDVLATGAARSHRVDANVVRLDIDIDIFCFRQYRHGRGGRVDPAARFCCWNALNAMHAGFELQRAKTPDPVIDAMISLYPPRSFSETEMISVFQPLRSA